MAFNLDEYEPVASRIQRFYERFPNGAIHTEIVFDDGQRIVIKASVWRDITDPMPSGVDYAEEILTDRGVNMTSRIENCATSSAGRAVSIAAGGLAPSDHTKKPSREEMAKVERRGGSLASNARPVTDDERRTIVNKFKAPCRYCGSMVEAGAGVAWKNRENKWETYHAEGQCVKEEPF